LASVEDIRVLVAWRDHPKRKKLQRRLGADGVVALLDLWLWAAANRTGGVLTAMSEEDVEIAAQWAGQPGAFVRELVALRLIDRADDDQELLSLHDWGDHQRWASTAAARSEAAKRAADLKWQNRGVDLPPDAKRHERLAAARARGTHTHEEWAALLEVCGRKCVKCGAPATAKDHIVPIYQGGSDAIDNLQPLCKPCNSRKGPDSTDLRPADWRARLRSAAETPAPGEKTPADPPKTPPPLPSPSPYPSPNTEHPPIPPSQAGGPEQEPAMTTTTTTTAPQQLPLGGHQEGAPSARSRKRAAAMAVHRAAALRVFTALNDARQRVIPKARRLEANEENLRYIVERLEAGASEEACLHVIAVREAEVRRKPDASGWFDQVTPFRAQNFARAVGQAIDQRSAPIGRAAVSDFSRKGPGEL